MAVILSACHDRGSVQQNITLTCLSIHLLWYVTSSSFAALHVCVAHPRAFWQCAASDSIWIFANSHSLPALPLSFFSLLILNFDFYFTFMYKACNFIETISELHNLLLYYCCLLHRFSISNKHITKVHSGSSERSGIFRNALCALKVILALRFAHMLCSELRQNAAVIIYLNYNSWSYYLILL